jgi:RNA exonuclease 4
MTADYENPAMHAPTSPATYHPPLGHCSDDITTSSEGYEFHDACNCVAMDCEMVGVGPMGQLSVLARVSIVDWYGAVVLDTFVKVHERVVDYRSHVSGIREADLASDRALEFGVVRTMVQNVVRGKVLVGHGLANDLKVFHLKHPWHMIRDSATYQPLMRFNLQPRRLKELAGVELGLSIQRDGIEHDSIEDALAAMEIYKRHQAGWDYDIRSMMTPVQMPTCYSSY